MKASVYLRYVIYNQFSVGGARNDFNFVSKVLNCYPPGRLCFLRSFLSDAQGDSLSAQFTYCTFPGGRPTRNLSLK